VSLAIVNNTAMNIGVQISQDCVLNSFEYIHPEVDLLDHLVIHDFLKTCHVIFYSDCIILHSHQQCASVPISLHPTQHIISYFFLNSSNLNGVSIAFRIFLYLCHLKYPLIVYKLV
jgi:hypothetical protein